MINFKLVSVFSIRLFGAAITFFITLVLARLYSSEEAGELMFMVANVQVIGTLFSLGGAGLCLRCAASENSWDNINNTVSIIKALALTVSFISFFLLFFYSVIAEYDLLYSLLTYGFIGGGLYSIILLLCACLLGRGYTIVSSIVQNILIPMPFLVFILFLYINEISYSEKNVGLVYVLFVFLSLIVTASLWYQEGNSEFNFDLYKVKEVLRVLSPFTITVYLNLVTVWGGNYMLAAILTKPELAYYMSSHRLVMLVGFVFSPLSTLLAPKIASHFSKNELGSVELIGRWAIRITLLFSMLVSSFLFFFSDELMGLFGDEYIEYAGVMKIMLLGQLIFVISSPLSVMLMMTNKELVVRNITMFTSLVTITLSFFLTIYFGLYGTALAFTLSFLFYGVHMIYSFRKHLGFKVL